MNILPLARCLYLFLGIFLVGQARAEMRTFTDRQGRTVQAEKVLVANGNAVLRLASGTTITVPVVNFCDADQAWLRAPVAPGSSPEAVAGASAGAPITWDYDAKPHGVPDLSVARFRIWIPDAAKPVRGMIALVPGVNGDGRGDAAAGDWQQLATELGFGLIACNFDSGANGNAGYCSAAKGSGKALLSALDQFAGENKHPEVAKAPLLLWGHSAGGQFNYNFACWKPERTIAFIVNEGGFFYDTVASPQTRATPAIIFAGEKDTPERVQNLTKLFNTGRARGALWAFCMEKGLGHAVGRSKEVSQQFFRAVVPMRLPSGGLDSSMKHLVIADGLLAAPGSDAVPAPDFKGTSRTASWLPDAATAAKWKAVQ
jgi:pimeloyl-ACP methyl ester carboxylesterase